MQTAIMYLKPACSATDVGLDNQLFERQIVNIFSVLTYTAQQKFSTDKYKLIFI